MHTSKINAFKAMMAISIALQSCTMSGEAIKLRTEFGAISSRTRPDCKDRNSGGNRVSQAKRRKYARQLAK